MLHLVGIRILPLVLPQHLAGVIGDLADPHLGLGPLEVFIDPTVAAGELSALARDPHAARIDEVDAVVVIDLTRLARHPILLATGAVGRLRHAVEEPVGDVDVVDVLLADVVAREPVEVVPVVDLELHLRLVRLAVAVPDAAAVPVDLPADDVAGEPFADPLHRLAVAVLVAALETDDHLELLLVGHLCRRQADLGAKAVDAHRLLHEDVLPRLHRFLEVERPEAGGRREDDHVTVLEDLLVGIDPLEAPILGAFDLVLHLLDGPQGTVDAVAEGIADSGQLDVRPRHRERLLEGTGATAAGADEADADDVARRVLPVHDRHCGEGAADRSGDLEGVAAGEGARGGAWADGCAHRRGTPDRGGSIQRRTARIPCRRRRGNGGQGHSSAAASEPRPRMKRRIGTSFRKVVCRRELTR